MNEIIAPRTVIRLSRLWPHARKQGREKGQIYRIGYFCKHCGTDVIWLVDEEGQYKWTADLNFIKNHFEILEESSERSLYGKGKQKIEPLTKTERRKLSNQAL